MTRVDTPILDSEGKRVAGLRVATLRGRDKDRLEVDGSRTIVEEEGTYHFEIDWPGELPLHIAPGGELFSFDDESLRTGRLTPRQHVGRIQVAVKDDDRAGHFVLSVEPRKLSAVTEYHQMLDDIAEVAVEAILQGFAPASVALQHEPTAEPRLLYQQFAFIHARLTGGGSADLARILYQPHRGWITHQEERPPGIPLPGGSRNIRALSRPGPRVPAPPRLGLSSVPARMSVDVTDATLDTEANRFIKFALERWRSIAMDVHARLVVQLHRTGPVSRGVDAAEEIVAMIDGSLDSPLFRSVGRLRTFPIANTVLQSRAGYREIFRTFVLAETGARLALNWDIDDIFGASQRNVATLYEYWAFLKLTSALGAVCGNDLSAKALVPSSDGLSLGFPRGKKSVLAWTKPARNREMVVELFFNRSFLVSAQPDSSWSRAMRPDCSVSIRPSAPLGPVSPADLQMWLHFDAKYKIEQVDGQFGKAPDDDEASAASAEEIERLGRSKREDLLKMHAYRDAIRRSAGAYVLYPGDSIERPFSEYTEVLPGLGAFPLKPTPAGAFGQRELELFLTEVIDHAADRATQHERSRYWRAVVNRPAHAPSFPERALPDMQAPPDDVPVLCGYVRSRAQYEWIRRTGLYNVRAGNRRGSVGADAAVLQPRDVLLHGPEIQAELWHRSGAWFVQARADLLALGYPTPSGDAYLVCPLEAAEAQPSWLASVNLHGLAAPGTLRGGPFVTTWGILLGAQEETA